MRYFIFISVLFIPVSLLAKDDARAILLQSYKTMQSKYSVSYFTSYRLKFYDGNDTMTFSGNVFLMKRLKDTIFHGKIWYSYNDTFYKFYDGHAIYEVIKNKKTVKSYNIQKGELFGMTGNIHHRVVWPYFLEPNKLKEYTDTANKLNLLDDTTINGKECYVISIEFPNENEFTNHRRLLFTDRIEYIPILTKRVIKFQDNYQFDQQYITSYTFNKVPQIKFSTKQIPDNYKIESYKSKPVKTIGNGTTAPLIVGKKYKEINTENITLKGKITLLDFWYTSCYPCIQTIPEIEKINEKYSANENIQIFGVNTYDNNNAGLARIPKFLEHNSMHYPILLVSPETIRNYQVEAWPTIYVIDQAGKIAYSHIGFSNKLSMEISDKIDELLKK